MLKIVSQINRECRLIRWTVTVLIEEPIQVGRRVLWMPVSPQLNPEL